MSKMAPGARRPSTRDSDMSMSPDNSRPNTGMSEFTDGGETTDYDNEDYESTDDEHELSRSRATTAAEPANPAIEEESDNDFPSDDESKEASQPASDDDQSEGLLPRRYPRSRMQVLIDQAEDANYAAHHPPEPEAEAGPEEPGDPEEAIAQAVNDNTDANASSRPGTAGGSRPGTTGGYSTAPSEAPTDSDKLPMPELTLNLSHLGALRVSSRVYELIDTLVILDLSHNKLTRLSPDCGELSSLTSLNISHNNITKLPAELEDLTKLTALDMSHNELSTYVR